jgi:hypothetical protein
MRLMSGGKRGRVMDKLVEHAIRMLEIVEGENDFFRNDAKRQADIARAVYDTILRVQVLERKADRKTENGSEIPNNFDKDTNVRSKDETLTCRNKDHYADCEYKDNCNPVVCFKALDEFREMVTEPQERSE